MPSHRTGLIRRLTLLGLGSLLLVVRPAAGQLPNPRLNGLSPSGARVGTTVEVVPRGEDLDGPEAIFFSHPGISGTLAKPDVPVWQRPQSAPFSVTVAPDVPAGVYEARVGGRFGLSTSWPFLVGDLPVVQEKGSNDSPANAMVIEPETIVEGELVGNKVDHYRFRAEPGQAFVLACECRPLHGRFDLMVEVTGPGGALLGSAVASRSREPVIAFKVREAGDHGIRVSDATFRGSDPKDGPVDRYRLTLSSRPRLTAVWPPVAAAGVSGSHRLLGFLLPGGRPVGGRRLEAIDVVIPPLAASTRRSGDGFPLTGLASVAIDAAPYRLTAPNGPSNPVAIGVAAAPPLPEVEPNERSAPQKVQIPCDVVGRFDDPADHDWYTFDAAKGDRLAVEVLAERLGAVTDVAVVVEHLGRDPQGKEQVRTVVEQDDPPRRFAHPPCDFESSDPRFVFAADQDGSYRIGVRNLAGGSYADTGAMYRLLVGPTVGDFRLLAAVGDLAANPGDANDATLNLPTIPRLRRGGRVPVVVQVHRSPGFEGPVMLGVEGLPPGVTCPPVTIAADVNEGSVVVAAADDVAAWRGPIRVIGTARIGAEDRQREAVWAAVTWTRKNPQQGTSARLVDEMPLEVIAEAAPLRVSVPQAEFGPVPRGGTVKIPFVLDTALEMKGAARVEVRDLPAAKPGPPYPKTPTKKLDDGLKAGEIEITIPADTPLGEHSIFLVAQASLVRVRDPEALAAATAALADFAARRTTLEAAVQAAGDDGGMAKAALDAHLKDEKPLTQRVDGVKKANEPKPTDVFAASQSIRLTITAPQPPAGAKAARSAPLLPLLAQAAIALAGAEEPRTVDFGREVLPILRANCVACHNASEAEGGIVLETAETMRAKGDNGPAVVPGVARESLMFQLAAHAKEPVMPPEDNDRGARRLTAEELETLRLWIDAGAAGGAIGPRKITWQPFPPGRSPIYATAVSADGKLVAAATADRVTVFDVATRKPVARLVDAELPAAAGGEPRPAAHLGAVRSLAFSPDGTRLASGGMRTVTVWKRSDDEAGGGGPGWKPETRIGSVERAEPFVDRVLALAFSPDGTLLAAGGGELSVSGDVALFEVETGRLVRRIAVPHKDAVACLAFSPDGRWLATGGDRVVGLAAVATGRQEHQFDEHNGRVLAIDWQADGSALTSVGADGQARVWKAGPWEKIEAIGLAGREAVGIRYLGKTGTFVVAEGDGAVRVRAAGQSGGGQPNFQGKVPRSQCLAADAAGSTIAVGGADGLLRVWTGSGGQPAVLGDPPP